MTGGSALRRKGGSLRLNHPAQLKKILQEPVIRLDLKDPGQDIWIEQMPIPPLVDPSASLRLGPNQPLGHQNANRLAISRTGDLALIAGVNLAVQYRSRLQFS